MREGEAGEWGEDASRRRAIVHLAMIVVLDVNGPVASLSGAWCTATDSSRDARGLCPRELPSSALARPRACLWTIACFDVLTHYVSNSGNHRNGRLSLWRAFILPSARLTDRAALVFAPAISVQLAEAEPVKRLLRAACCALSSVHLNRAKLDEVSTGKCVEN